MSFPRRSARLSPQTSQSQHQQHQQQFPASFPPTYSQPSSTSTTSHPSPVNDSANPPPPPPTPYTPNQQQQSRLQTHGQGLMPQNPYLNVPLPSPSATDMMDPFGGGRQQAQPTSYPSHLPQQQYSQQPPQQQYHQSQQQPQHHQHHHNSLSQSHLPNFHGAHVGQVPPPDFLAEAAKRAQMACLMRDLGDVSL